MLQRLQGRVHRTVTGVCLLGVQSGRRRIWADVALVRMEAIGEPRLHSYLESQEWRGEGGGYSPDERLRAGWPITFEGDAEVVLGLSTRRVREELHSFAAARDGGDRC